MTCPLCKGRGKIKPHPHPQNKHEEIECPVCHGARDVEEIKTDKSQIVIYKSWGMFAEINN